MTKDHRPRWPGHRSEFEPDPKPAKAQPAPAEPKAAPKASDPLPPDESAAVAALAWRVWSRQGDGTLTDSLSRPWSFMVVGEQTKALRVACGDASADTPQDALGVTDPDQLAAVVARVSATAGAPAPGGSRAPA